MHAVSINSNNLNEIYKHQQKQNDQRIQLPSLTIIHQSKLNASILSDFPSLINNHKAYSKPKQFYNPQHILLLVQQFYPDTLLQKNK